MRGAIINDLPSSYGNVDHGEIWDKVGRYSLDTLVIDVRQLEHLNVLHKQEPNRYRFDAKGTLDHIRIVKGKRVGVMIVPTDFDPDLTGPQEADKVADFIDSVGYRDLPLTAVFDDERHDPPDQIILPMLRRWRERKPTRKTIWAPEAMQAGWFSTKLISQIDGDVNLWVARQNYAGNMFPMDADAAYKDLLGHGIFPERIEQVTGAVVSTQPLTHLPMPLNWTGLMFTLELLA